LRRLDLSYNQLQGPIPSSLSGLVGLIELSLKSNRLSGPVPSQLSSLSNLESLKLDSNGLSGPIPPVLGSLRQLATLLLSNNQLNGSIPPELGNLTMLSWLELANNSLSGPIPSGLARAASFVKYFDLALNDNQLSGRIPPELFQPGASWGDLNLSSNALSGPIPPEIGNIQTLSDLSLSSNNLTGPIPPAIGNFSTLRRLELGNNHLSGGIPPELASLAFCDYFQLSNNNLSGPIPTGFGTNDVFYQNSHVASNNLSGPLSGGICALDLDVSSNDLSGPIPDTLADCFASRVDLSGNSFAGPPSKPRTLTPTALGLDYPLPSWLPNTTGIASLRLGVNNPPVSSVDLSRVPGDCRLVTILGPAPQLSNLRFWEACSNGSCVVNLIGTEARLSQSTRRTVCLGRISVFLRGDFPSLVIPGESEGGRANAYLVNQQGVYFLKQSNFVDQIDLGPGGLAYTGVSFSRVQLGNLCGNPEARTVVAVVWGTFAVLLVLAFAVLTLLSRRRSRAGEKQGGRGMGRLPWVRPLVDRGRYVWGVVSVVLPYADLYTDVVVLREVWGAWPSWVILASILAPFLLAELYAADAWAVRGGLFSLPACNPFLRVWPPDLREPTWLLSRTAEPAAVPYPQWLLRLLLLWPVAILRLPVYDSLGVLARGGLLMHVGDHVVGMDEYLNVRAHLDVLLRSLPQSLFQSVLYLLGSSRATRVFIDETIFISSIALSLVSLGAHLGMLYWEALSSGGSFLALFWGRPRQLCSATLFSRALPAKGAGEESPEKEEAGAV
jgi:Leucine-rich repeat (LRR) protein